MTVRQRRPASRSTNPQPKVAASEGSSKDQESFTGKPAPKDELEVLRACVADGEGGAVLAGLALCMEHSLPIPDWLKSEFLSRFQQVCELRVASWDDVFEPVLGRRGKKSLSLVKRKTEEWASVYQAVEFLRSRRRMKMGDALWARVAADLQLSSASKARERYYEARRIVESVNAEYRASKKRTQSL